MKGSEYFRCPYCSQNILSSKHKKLSKRIGMYRIKQTSDYCLIFECQKCLKIFRISFIGKPLLWSDLTSLERQVFKVNEWVSYATAQLYERE